MNAEKDCLPGEKPLVKSKTFWGTVFQFVPLLDVAASAAGYPGVVSDAVAIVSGAVGGLLVIYGRIKARDKIEGVLKAPGA